MLSYRAADANNPVDAGDLAQIPADFRKLFLTTAQTDPLVETLPFGVSSRLINLASSRARFRRGSFLRTKALRGAAARGAASCS
jgi:hypothetical protein